ncbi:hypothetical protein [Clostridium tagluense]|uniref:Uncharacterized protein n=1 Tax=Clostridium tagluense TaxID=360422 RepID=A0A401UUD7_9CLOT|nr:hypothetical protein [Clostridium tagluense]GCD13151.1 hypothetical protein Ctaglu_47740 [Clostridium tagluense]
MNSILDLRNDKVSLKSLLMKDVKTDDKGNVLLSKNDVWNENFEDLEEHIYSNIE